MYVRSTKINDVPTHWADIRLEDVFLMFFVKCSKYVLWEARMNAFMMSSMLMFSTRLAGVSYLLDNINTVSVPMNDDENTDQGHF